MFAGATDWKEVGRKTNDLVKLANTQWSPVRLTTLKDVNISSVGVGSNSAFCMAISDDGKVYAWGRNET